MRYYYQYTSEPKAWMLVFTPLRLLLLMVIGMTLMTNAVMTLMTNHK